MSSHSEGPASGQRATLGFWIIGIGIVLTIGIGLVVEITEKIWPPHPVPEGCPEIVEEHAQIVWHILEVIYNTLTLFHIEHLHFWFISKCNHSLLLAFAAVLGSLSFIAGLGSVFWVLLDDRRKAWKISHARNHLVVIGYGAKGHERAYEAVHEKLRVIAVEAKADEAVTAEASAHGVLMVEGDARDDKILARAHVERAASIVIATGDDARNLGITHLVLNRIGRERSRLVHTAIESPLIRRALDRHEMPNIEIFSTEEFAAYHLCDIVHFFEIADLLGQPRVHVVLVGFGATATHVVAQVLRTNVVGGLAPPAFTILSREPEESRNALRLAYPGAEKVTDIKAVLYDPLARPADDPGLLADVDKNGPVTAVVVLGEGGFEAIPTALAFREAARRSAGWKVPIFFAGSAREHFGPLEHPLSTTKLYSEVVQSFEASASLCTVAHTRERDSLARAIHERYQQVQMERHAAGEQITHTDATKDWSELSLTNRHANRRAADHVPAKLASAGCHVPDRKIRLSIDVDQILRSSQLETLAEIEHETWMIERLLEGWQYGPVRDNPARIHDKLVPYSDLTEPDKELDRDQIRNLLAKELPRTAHEPSPKAVRFDLWIGLIGTTNVAAGDTARLASEVAEAIGRIVEAQPNHYFTVLSPLAPGADLIATKKALAVLKAAKRPHRLLVPNVVRWRDVVDGFEPRWRAGAIADLDISAGPEWPAARGHILAEIDRIKSRHECERILEIGSLPQQSTEKQREWGYRLQNAYIVERAHVVIAAVKGDGAPEPGGTREAVLWRRSSDAIPAEFNRYRKRPKPLAPGLSDLITIDLNS